MKKMLAVMMTMSLILGLSACSGTKTEPAEKSKSAETAQAESSAQTGAGAQPEASTQSGQAAEMGYPKKEITCIIPYATGGGTDNLTRAIASTIDLPTSMVCKTIEGASGMIGAMEATKSSNDGYTMLAHNPIDLICYYLSGGSEDVKIWEELTPVCCIVGDPGIVITSKDSGIASVDDLYALNPADTTWGFVGTRGQLVAIQTLVGLGLQDATAVPYSSGTDCITSVMGGHVTVASCNVGDLGTVVESGEVIPLLIIGDERCAAFPDLPCTGELDITATGSQYRGYFVPKGTDEAIVKYLCDQMEALTQDEEFLEKMETLGFMIDFRDYEETTGLIDEWFAQFEPIYKEYCK